MVFTWNILSWAALTPSLFHNFEIPQGTCNHPLKNCGSSFTHEYRALSNKELCKSTNICRGLFTLWLSVTHYLASYSCPRAECVWAWYPLSVCNPCNYSLVRDSLDRARKWRTQKLLLRQLAESTRGTTTTAPKNPYIVQRTKCRPRKSTTGGSISAYRNED